VFESTRHDWAIAIDEVLHRAGRAVARRRRRDTACFK
jgi:hypothetical protein